MHRTLNGVDLSRLFLTTKGELRHFCAACRRPIVIGESYTRIRVGPGANPKERERARRGDAYNAVCVPVHWACATGEED